MLKRNAKRQGRASKITQLNWFVRIMREDDTQLTHRDRLLLATMVAQGPTPSHYPLHLGAFLLLHDKS